MVTTDMEKDVGSSLRVLIVSCLSNIQMEVSNSWAFTSRTKDRSQYLYMITCLEVIGNCVVFKAMGLAEIIKGDNTVKEEVQE